VTLFNDYKVEYFDGSAWVEIDELLNLTCNIGRKQITDTWPVSTASFTFRYSTGFASPNTDLLVDVPIRFFSPSDTSVAAWTGFIRDVRVAWGIPFESGVGQSDQLIIEGEGALALWGRTQGDGFTGSNNFANGQLTEVANHYGLSWNGNLTSEPVKAAPTDGPLSGWLQQFSNTVQGRLIDGAPRSLLDDANRRGTILLVSNATFFATAVNFSDSLNNATNAVYNVLDFDSLADNYVTQVTVQSPGLADQTAQIGSAPFRGFVLQTYTVTTAQSLDIANYVLGALDEQTVAPNVISVSSSSQISADIDTMGTFPFFFLPACKTKISFRGTTYSAQIEGATLTAGPEQTRITYYLSSADSNPFFILDNPTFGVLDQNKLGLYVY
jgi:hypothetical protein